MSDEVYFRIYHSTRADWLTVVCMQWFDEHDYHEDRFMTDEDGERLRFETEEEAIKWLNDNVKEEHIDPDNIKVKFNRERFLKEAAKWI